jgi:hypothetical protein
VPVAVPTHPVPPGPLAVRYVAYELTPPRAASSGAIRVELENAGTGTWFSFGPANVRLSHHWYDRFGHVLVWEGQRTLLPHPVQPGERLTLDLPLAFPMPPDRYRLAIDLVDEGRLWFEELGNRTLDLDLDVLPRLPARALAVDVGAGPDSYVVTTRRALAAQEEAVAAEGEAVAFLAAGCAPMPDWSRRILDALDEGHAVVAGSIEVRGVRLGRRGAARALEPWKPGFGKAPTWPRALLCPSMIASLLERAPWTEPVGGLPALDPAGLGTEPWLCDGRIRVDVEARALRRADRRPA